MKFLLICTGIFKLRILFIVCLALLSSACSHLIFHPEKEHYPIPESLGIVKKDIFFETEDGLKLHGWYLPAKSTKPRGTLLFLHGNAQNISTHIRQIWWLPQKDINVFLFDYRGFGKSEGEPTLEGLQLDFAAALKTLFALPGVEDKKVIVYGQSLGAALAITHLAHSNYRNNINSIIVEGAFTSFRKVAQEALDKWWLTWAFQKPLSLTISDQFRPIDDIALLSPTPLLIVHGRNDNIINEHHAHALYRAAKDPKHLWFVTNIGHNSAFLITDFRHQIIRYLYESF